MANTDLTSYLNNLANDYYKKGDFGRFYGISRASRVIYLLDFEVNSVEQLDGLPFIGDGIKKKVKKFLNHPFHITTDKNPHKHYMKRDTAEKVTDSFRRFLMEFFKGSDCIIAGSFRRGKSIVGDIDLTLIGKNIDFATLSQKGEIIRNSDYEPFKFEVTACGEQKMKGVLHCRRRVIEIDIRAFPKSQLGSALCYFTGPYEHNVVLRQLAKDKGMKLSEYGITDSEGHLHTFRTEQGVYKFLGLEYIEPQNR